MHLDLDLDLDPLSMDPLAGFIDTDSSFSPSKAQIQSSPQLNSRNKNVNHAEIKNLANICFGKLDVSIRITAMEQLQLLLLSDMNMLVTADGRWTLDLFKVMIE
jgi:hypothetical protein